MIIDEIYLAAAVRIRSKYITLNNDIKLYESYLRETLNLVNRTAEKIKEMENDLNNPKKRPTLKEKDMMMKVYDLLGDLDKDASRLEDKVNPVNKEIEKLAVEEAELYRSIKDKYPSLDDNEIVRQVRERLNREGLM